MLVWTITVGLPAFDRDEIWRTLAPTGSTTRRVDGNLISARTPDGLGPWLKALLVVLRDS
ncbi:MAG: hypothetical protein JO287_22485 [Pseudonocardiales bacterium]|nr:hypothetical protein [Pseudonocardiales bacterium]